jgi:spore coat protein A, manganese oxidase
VSLTRRQFLIASSALAAVPAAPALDPNSLARFVDPLPIPQIAVARESKVYNGRKLPFYRIPIKQVEAKVHRDLPATRWWGYGGSVPGPTFEARSGEGLLVEWANELPAKHMFAIDHRLHGAEPDRPEVRTVVHIHGAKIPAESDGYPEDWCVPGKSATTFYPIEQEAAMLWYHDHAMGITRLNIYAGLFGAFLVRDAAEDALGLPRGRYEIPLVVSDRFLRQDGQLDYPVSGDAEAPWVPEVFGNAMLVNGKLFPFLDVEPRKYRFRLLNASNGRFYHLSLSNGQEFYQLGSDQGLLPAPVKRSDFVIAPGERMDLILDFRDHAGEQIVLNNDAFVVMQFRVGKTKVTDDSSMPSQLRDVIRIPESSAVKTRVMTIDEYHNGAGDSMRMLLNKSHWSMPVTETPVLDSTEIWSILNPTEDSHPIHLHMVRFQVLDQRRYDSVTYRMTGQIRFTGPPVPPEPGEAGWKDTVPAHAKMITRIIVPFRGFPGRYVWHCHVLEHEDNEMMRPFEVVRG